MGETIRDAVEEYLASSGDLRPTTVEGYRIVAEERVYGPYGDLPACEMPRIAAELAAGERDEATGVRQAKENGNAVIPVRR